MPGIQDNLISYFKHRVRSMMGGLYFGRPCWKAATWIFKPEEIKTDIPKQSALPGTRDELIYFLHHAGLLQRTCATTQSLFEQLAALRNRKVDLLIINLIPQMPESILPCVMTEFEFPVISAAVDAIRNGLGDPPTVIAMDHHDCQSIRVWRKAAGTQRWRVCPMVNRYPLAAMPLIVRALTGRTVSPGESPAEHGVVVVDPVGCWMFGQALVTGKASERRPVQVFVAGSEPRVCAGRIGETVGEFLHRAGISVQSWQCIHNGMLAGTLVDLQSDHIQSWTETISLRPIPDAEAVTDCIRCGWCVLLCPTSLNPAALFAAPEVSNASTTALRLEARGCIDCGLCSYVCPSRLPLASTIKSIRKQLEAEGTF
ncbi:MAG TPA: 4Fe-4S dicluster domain-containing protein [Phycisphaerae bacterium]|nr:4Fe-4S dicluster domain-containing protein [Phycisphaerae bacterium]